MRSSLAVLLCTLNFRTAEHTLGPRSFVSAAIGAELELQSRLDRSGDKIDGHRIYLVRRTGIIVVNIIQYNSTKCSNRSVPVDPQTDTKQNKTTQMKYRIGE